MNEGVLELAKKVKSLENKIKRCKNKCAELEEQIPFAQQREEELSPLQHSDNPRERAKYVDAYCKRTLLQVELTNTKAVLTSTMYELDQINSMNNELRQAQPE